MPHSSCLCRRQLRDGPARSCLIKHGKPSRNEPTALMLLAQFLLRIAWENAWNVRPKLTLPRLVQYSESEESARPLGQRWGGIRGMRNLKKAIAGASLVLCAGASSALAQSEQRHVAGDLVIGGEECGQMKWYWPDKNFPGSGFSWEI